MEAVAYAYKYSSHYRTTQEDRRKTNNPHDAAVSAVCCQPLGKVDKKKGKRPEKNHLLGQIQAASSSYLTPVPQCQTQTALLELVGWTLGSDNLSLAERSMVFGVQH